MVTQVVFSKNGYTYVVHVAEMNVACYCTYEGAKAWLDFAKRRKLVVSGNVEFWGK